jgi:class 3 adenylate cyclase
MGCEQCGHENLEGSKFCSECGAPLAATCGSCGADQPAGAKFCNQCGSSLSNDPTKPIPAPLARSDGAARKQVTAVFADLAGSTAFGEQLDPEAAREALAPYFELLQSTIEDHLGTVAKFMGDGMMALFGVPEVAEDDALRAVNAGVELQTRFRAFAERVRDRHGVELGLRVGVNSGELVIADGDADIVGDVLNTAARLESSCTPGRVLVGEDTWRLTRSGIRYEVMGEVRVKGKADPVAAFQVADTEAVAIEENIPFVGRTSELDELMAAFAVTRDSPTANLVTIVGAAGVGKTRLAYELRAATEARSFDLRFAVA